jgi:hypothetical protein
MLIKFTQVDGLNDLYPPIPASKNMPEWYKKTNSYVGDIKKPSESGGTSATIKKCLPVFDAITAGYLILLNADVYVQPDKEGGSFFIWTDNNIEFHANSQADKHPIVKNGSIPKFMNKWIVATPKGYSTLFIQPMHRDLPFKILEGVVDTDNYYLPTNFIFAMNDLNFEGLIPAGTPIAQAIPIKRDSFTHKIEKIKPEKYLTVNKFIHNVFFDGYKNRFWKRKEYK